jgi:hypothetical protein
MSNFGLEETAIGDRSISTLKRRSNLSGVKPLYRPELVRIPFSTCSRRFVEFKVLLPPGQSALALYKR